MRSEGIGYAGDGVLTSPAAAATLYPGVGTLVDYKYTAGFGRLNYNWVNKYIINLTARKDGSSRFGSNNEFHDFGWLLVRHGSLVRKIL